MSTHERGVSASGGLFGLPRTLLGRVSSVLFLAGVALVMLMSTLFDSTEATVGDFNIFGGVNFLVLLAALVTGATAIIKDGERSLVVWLSTGLCALVVGFVALMLLIPGAE